MTNEQHTFTPGPWIIEGNCFIVRKIDNAAICDLYPVRAEGSFPEEEHEANARLIAAAPELLDACKEAYSWFLEGNRSNEELRSEICEILRAAIAKARGEQNTLAA